MIYTLTLNPNIDYFLRLSRPAALGTINRAACEWMLPGGKGVNVSLVLARLGAETRAMGFVAGESGEMFLSLLRSFRCPADFVRLPAGQTRINVKLEEEVETAFNGKGPDLTPGALDALVEKLAPLSHSDTLVLSGNTPPSLPEAFDALAALANTRGARLVVDTAGDALRRALQYRPFLIKPNADELCELCGAPVPDAAAAAGLAQQLRAQCAQNVLVSLGADGAVLAAGDGCTYRAGFARRFCVRSTIGAGDSMLAGFLAGLAAGRSYDSALRLAAAAGTATACSDALAEASEIESVFPAILIETLPETGKS